MAPNENCFLETTAVIDYIFHTKNFDKIEAILKNYTKKITSNYVKMEIKRGFLQYLVSIHGKVVQTNNLFEVFEYIHNLSATPHRNRLSAILQLIADYYKSMEKDIVDPLASQNQNIKSSDIAIWQKKQIESFLRSKIRRCFKNIDAKLDEVINPMNCYSDIQPPKQVGRIFDNRSSWCTGSNVKCNIKNFFQQNNTPFQQVYSKLKSLTNPDSETTQRIASLNNIFALLTNNRNFSNKEALHTVKRCWHCGDAILAVTAPDEYDVINNNTKHYDPICRAISKTSQSY